MTKSDLIQLLAGRSNLSNKQSAVVANEVFEGMVEALTLGESIEIRGFGSFKLKNYPGYQGRNPRTGEVIEVADKRMPVFKVGKEMRERLQRGDAERKDEQD